MGVITMEITNKNIAKTIIPTGCTEHIVTLCRNQAAHHGPLPPFDIFGKSQVIPGYMVGRTTLYPWHVVLLVQKGELALRTEETNMTERIISANTLVFLPAHSRHVYGTNDKLALTWFHLNPECPTWHFLQQQESFFREHVGYDNLPELTMMLYRENSVTSLSGIGYHALQLVTAILEHKLQSFVVEDESERRLRQTFDIIETALEQSWTVHRIAQLCNWSEPNLYLATKKYYGCSPMAIVHAMRMKATRTILDNTSYKLDTIASMVGLGTGFALSRAFKKCYGVSPKCFRHAHK